MDKEIERLIEIGREAVTKREAELQTAIDQRYQAELDKRKKAWDEVLSDVRDAMPDVLREYLAIPDDMNWRVEGRPIIGSPMPSGEHIPLPLRVDGLAPIWIVVSKPEDHLPWMIDEYRVELSSEYDNRRIQVCESINQALYYAKLIFDEEIKRQIEYEEMVREYEYQASLERDPEAQSIDVEKLLKQAKARVDDTDLNYDPIARTLIAIGWMLMEKYYV